MGKVLLIVSGKGGTGKTSMCSGIACALAVNGQKTLAIDADSGMRNLDICLGMTGDVIFSFEDVAKGRKKLMGGAAESRTVSGLYMLTAPVNENCSEIDPHSVGEMLEEAKRLFDWVLIDCPAGMGNEIEMFAGFCSMAIVVVTLDTAAIRCGELAASKLYNCGVENIRLIVNRVRKDILRHSDGAVDDAVDYTGLQLLGMVPEDKGISKASAMGTAIFSYCSMCSYNAFRNIAMRLNGRNVPLVKL